MKKITILLFALVLSLLFCACGGGDSAADAQKNDADAAQTTADECAEGHTEVIDAAVAATCTQTGLTEGKHCSVCNTVILAQEEVPMTDHTWKEATCTEAKTCEVCKVTEGSVLDHTWTDATCAEPKTCTACEATEGNALGHTWTDATCAEPKTCSVCKATEGEALGHTWTDATCTTPQTCTVCGKTSGDAAGHKYSDATCTEPKTCKVCGKTEGTANGHNEVIDKAVEATCTTEGKTEGKHCSVCKTVLVKSKVIEKTDHASDGGRCVYCNIVTTADVALMNYLIHNGNKSESSNSYAIVKSISSTDYLVIQLDCDTCEISFSLTTETDDSTTFTYMVWEPDSSTQTTGLLFRYSGIDCYASGTIYTGSFNSETKSIYRFECNVSSLSTSLKTLLGSSTATMLLYCDVLLQEQNTGITMEMMGFTNLH